MKFNKSFFNFLQIFIIFLSFLALFDCHLGRLHTWEEFKNRDSDDPNEVEEVINGDTVKIGEAFYQISTSVNRFSDNKGNELLAGVDYRYGEMLRIYDYNNGDIPLARGKYLRINYNDVNIASIKEIGGLGLTPIARDLSNDENNKYLTPLPGNFFIDPASGKFILPRPVYWSYCSSIGNLENANIGTAEVENYNSRLNVINVPHKFDSGIRIKCKNPRKDNSKYLNITPVCYNSGLENEGSISLWVMGDFSGESWNNESFTPYKFRYYFNEHDYVNIDLTLKTDTFLGQPLPVPPHYRHRVYLKVNGTSRYVTCNIRRNIKHIFITYDKDEGIDIYLDNNKIISYYGSFTPSNNPYLQFRVYGTLLLNIDPEISFDNIKIWNKKMADPSFEYNENIGRERALYDIYKMEDDYEPSASYFKVFYYYLGN
ncbi:MAG: hypothetical protein JXB50_13350 [Spirochaetes bacterium]|nr:hypothetical protein [Spirochaetota bacterium]